MNWPQVHHKIDTQTAEIKADLETRQSVSMKDHLEQVEMFATGNDSLQVETMLV
jgi:hypothetical protein